ncbi:hypothetical protein MKZ38_000822 [Zalerion maritima]|uniref:RNA-binding protein n=1 Tax=Zalerion maritima TaxID=339359 RepID=A0AAD5WU72_9PEZI|nr:hypothetical protein MKZ38_000822 [Zalerion maritima]
MNEDTRGGAPPQACDYDHPSLARNREHQPGGAYELEYGQDNRSWKDQSRSPSHSYHHQERDSSSRGPPGDYQSYQHLNHPGDHYSRSEQYQQPHPGSHQYPPFRPRNRSSSRDRGDYRPYRLHDQERDYGYHHNRRDRDALRYEDSYDDLGDRRLCYDDDDNYRSRDGDRRAPYRSRRDNDYPSRRGRTPSPHPGGPRETVLVEGIMPDIEEHDVNFGLNALQLTGLQDIRIRRERNSARRIAFLEFDNVQNASAFVDSYPDLTVTLQLPHNAPVRSCRVRISYSWARKDDSRKDWMCPQCRASNFSSRYECLRCGEPRHQDSTESDEMPMLTGEKDACPNQKPYPIVVITGLESSTSEEVFAKGVMKLYLNETEDTSQHATGPSGLKTTAPVGNTKGLGARPGSLRRVFLIRDRKTRASWKYGFAEFATTDDAVKAVSKFHASPRFTIASKPVTVAYIHTGVFVPVLPPEPQIAPYVFAVLHNPDVKLRYWEYRAYANAHVVSTQQLAGEPNTDKEDGQSKKEKKRKAEKEVAGVAKKKTLVMAPQMQMWANKSAEIRGESSNDMPLGERRPIPERDMTPQTLDVPMPEELKVPIATPLAPPKQEAIWSYANPEKICCLLCKRKFGSLEQMKKHEMASSMHRENLKDEAKKAAATKNLAAVGLKPSIVEGGPQYRDRAKERRAVHHQPTKPSQEPKKDSCKGEKSSAETPAAAAPPAGPPKMSKGMAMLSKMGLKAGEGLGADGSGRMEIINTDMYRPGVGLGAEGAKIGDAAEEAKRMTKGDYNDFLRKTQDKARERFERLSKEE